MTMELLASELTEGDVTFEFGAILDDPICYTDVASTRTFVELDTAEGWVELPATENVQVLP